MFTEDKFKSMGEYSKQQPCPKCERRRLLDCIDRMGKERIICERCYWEPAINACYWDAEEGK